MTIKKFSKGEAIRFGWGTMKSNLGFFIGLLIVMPLLFIVPAFIAGVILAINAIAGIIFHIAIYILIILIYIGWIKITLKFCDNEKGAFTDLFSHYRLLFKCLLGFILYGLVLFGGAMILGIPVISGIILLNLDPDGLIALIMQNLLMIPVIILGIQFWFFDYFIVDKRLGPIEALKRSSAMTKGAKWDLFVFFLMLIGINILGALSLLIGLFATIPTTMIATAFVYRKLLSQTEIAPASGTSRENISEPLPVTA